MLSRGSSVSEKEEHLKLASVVKGVHAKLRRELQESNGDFEKIWNEHCSNQDLLTEYAEAMHHLATDHWTKNPETRIHWCRRTCLEYFLEGGMKKALEKEERQKLFNRQFSHRDSMSSQTSEDCEVSVSNVIITEGLVTHTPFFKEAESGSDLESSFSALSNLHTSGQDMGINQAFSGHDYWTHGPGFTGESVEHCTCVLCQKSSEPLDRNHSSHWQHTLDRKTKHTEDDLTGSSKKLCLAKCNQRNWKGHKLDSQPTSSDLLFEVPGDLDSENIRQTCDDMEGETTIISECLLDRKKHPSDSTATVVSQATLGFQPISLQQQQQQQQQQQHQQLSDSASIERVPQFPSQELHSVLPLTEQIKIDFSLISDSTQNHAVNAQVDIYAQHLSDHSPSGAPQMNRSNIVDELEPPFQAPPFGSPVHHQAEPPFRNPLELSENNHSAVTYQAEPPFRSPLALSENNHSAVTYQTEPPSRDPIDISEKKQSVSPSSEVQSLPSLGSRSHSLGSQSLGGQSSSSGMESDSFLPLDQELWKKKQQQMSRGNYTSITLPFLGKIRLLDVGSCFNPFREYEEFMALGIDISPAVESVYHCDFLHLELSESLQLAVDTMDSYLHSIKDPIERLPAECFHVVVFSLLLEYFPSPYQRWLCCQKAQNLLMVNGLLLVITPDSGHQNKNAPMMKSWKKAIESLGFKRWKYIKQEHLHCMAFRKIHQLSSTESCLVGEVTPDMLYIPQDFNEIKLQSKNFGISFSDNTLDDYNCIRDTFNELPLAEESEEDMFF